MLLEVMGGADVLIFIPLALTVVDRHPELMELVDYWWGTCNTSWITPE
jgi:hypothetical protein